MLVPLDCLSHLTKVMVNYSPSYNEKGFQKEYNLDASRHEASFRSAARAAKAFVDAGAIKSR